MLTKLPVLSITQYICKVIMLYALNLQGGMSIISEKKNVPLPLDLILLSQY